jgi:hypothetical protein
MKTKKIFVMLFLGLTTLTSFAHAEKVGNGGDLIRETFMAEGRAVIKYLNSNRSGRSLTRENHLDLNKLSEYLSIEKIRVTTEILHDTGGSVVDSLGSPEGITLNQMAWVTLLNSASLQKMVFHEMLRTQSKNDDNYVISNLLPHSDPRPELPVSNVRYRELRTEFSEARNVTIDDLSKTIQWIKDSNGRSRRLDCQSETTQNQDSQSTKTFGPTLWRDKIFQMNLSSQSDYLNDFEDSDFGWIGLSKYSHENLEIALDMHGYSFARINEQGDFLFEVSFPNDQIQKIIDSGSDFWGIQKYYSTPSLIAKTLSAYQYWVCSPVETAP